MSNLIEPSPEEPRAGGGNRVFVLMALGLAGLLVLGLLLVFGYLLLQRLQPRPGPTPIVTEIAGSPVGTVVGGTPITTLLPGALTATALAPTATATRVVGGPSPTPPSGTGAAQATVTRPPNVTSAPGGASPTPVINPLATATPTVTAVPSAPTATPTPGDNNLPSTGVEMDMLVIGVLMVILLLIARGFRMALR